VQENKRTGGEGGILTPAFLLSRNIFSNMPVTRMNTGDFYDFSCFDSFNISACLAPISRLDRHQRHQASREDRLTLFDPNREDSGLVRTFPVTPLSLTRPAVARVFSYASASNRTHLRVGAGNASISEVSVHLRHPALLGLLRSSIRCCPPVISSITTTTMSFSISLLREAGSLINQPVTFAP
jgi:hypothetical protein